MDINQLWDLISGAAIDICIICIGVAVLMEAVKKVAKTQLKKYLPILPLVFGTIGMYLISLTKFPSTWQEIGQWLAVYGSLGLFAGALNKKVYNIIEKRFLDNLKDNNDIK